MAKHVRCAAKAIIVRDGRLLVVHMVDTDGDWYMLPGGGQDHGETVYECLRRECLEEIGVEVEVALKKHLGELGAVKSPLYLGDVN